jgi:uncharacterized phage protein (TIGR01671 family)
MREIKFRAWDKQNNKFLPHICKMGSSFPSPDYCYHFLQYTGLKDKNGNEIYEGDVVVRTYRKDLFPKRKPVRGVIEWTAWNAQFIIKIIDKDAYYDEFMSNPTTLQDTYLEVIGNIYEHPELLTPNPTK